MTTLLDRPREDASRASSALDASIEVASLHVVRTDIAYHRQLAKFEELKARGLDTSQREKIVSSLRDQLERNHAWLRSLRSFWAR
jgi:Golgi nucleoside diphosphatase